MRTLILSIMLLFTTNVFATQTNVPHILTGMFITTVQNFSNLVPHTVVQKYKSEQACIDAKLELQNAQFYADPTTPFLSNKLIGTTSYLSCTKASWAGEKLGSRLAMSMLGVRGTPT